MTETASDTASDTTGHMSGDATPARPASDNADAWKAYWQAQGMPWRTEPEISTEARRILPRDAPSSQMSNKEYIPSKRLSGT
jgi:hypothetical protein